jgi:LPS sulfotransferase NodH
MAVDSLPRISALVCTLPRSGSWLLAEYLHNTDRAGTPEEYFRPDYYEWYLSQWGAAAGLTITEYIRLCMARTATSNRVFSAKLHWYQMEWLLARLGAAEGTDAAPHALIDRAFPGVRYVHLIREDTALQALSWYRAIQTDSWFRFHGTQQPRDELRPDMQEVRWLEDLIVQHAERWRTYFRSAGVGPLTVSFADLVQHPDRTVRQVLSYLDAGYPSDLPVPAGRLVRQSDEWTDFWVCAYRQVRNALPRLDASVRWNPALNRFIRVGAHAVDHDVLA